MTFNYAGRVLALIAKDDRCDECGQPVTLGQECSECFAEDASLTHTDCCPEAKALSEEQQP